MVQAPLSCYFFISEVIKSDDVIEIIMTYIKKPNVVIATFIIIIATIIIACTSLYGKMGQGFIDQAPVVQRLDNAIHRINRYPANKC